MRTSIEASDEGEDSAICDDQAVVKAALADPAAFGVLYERYRNRIYWYLLAHTHSVEDAADLTQQVFLRAFDALHQYRPHKGAFFVWLMAIAHHSSANFHRGHRKTLAWEDVPEHLHPTTDVDTEIVRRETLAHAQALLDELDSSKRELLILRFVAGLTASQIASVIGKSEAATKKQLARTLHMLKEKYYDTSR